MLLSGLTPMDKYLPHSTLADMNATHLDIELVRIAARSRSLELLHMADELDRLESADEIDFCLILDRVAATLRQLAEGK